MLRQKLVSIAMPWWRGVSLALPWGGLSHLRSFGGGSSEFPCLERELSQCPACGEGHFNYPALPKSRLDCLSLREGGLPELPHLVRDSPQLSCLARGVV